MDRRIHKRRPATFQVRVSEVSTPELSVSGQACDISESGIGIDLPIQFKPGSVVRLNINDCVLFGFVAHSTPERSGFRTGIEVVQVLLGNSDLAQLLKVTLQEAMPSLHLKDPVQSQ